jgi:hypothetical protein
LLSALVIAYLDTHAFGHIYQKIGCTSADIANLRKIIYGRQLSIRLSIHTLEEVLLGRKVSPQAFAAQIKLTLSLASSRTLIKGCGRLVVDDIRSYAARGEPERPFLPGDMQNAVADGISTLIESDGEEVEEDFLAVLEEARREKLQLFAMLEHANKIAESISEPPVEWAGFEQYFDAAAPQTVEAMAEGAGVLASCRTRGLNGLLEIKSVRMSVCAALAPSFDRLTAGASSPAEFHHAVSAAAVAEIYVTESAATREFLKRLPNKSLKVAPLPEFLNDL